MVYDRGPNFVFLLVVYVINIVLYFVVKKECIKLVI